MILFSFSYTPSPQTLAWSTAINWLLVLAYIPILILKYSCIIEGLKAFSNSGQQSLLYLVQYKLWNSFFCFLISFRLNFREILSWKANLLRLEKLLVVVPSSFMFSSVAEVLRLGKLVWTWTVPVSLTLISFCSNIETLLYNFSFYSSFLIWVWADFVSLVNTLNYPSNLQ